MCVMQQEIYRLKEERQLSSKLTFSIEESLWLNRGQEISEVLAMSLEPNISIQEMGDHVVIKGGLLLQGEYRPVEQDSNEEDFVDDDVKLSSHRLAKEVTVTEDGVGEVKHFIPIDVTIPVDRIQNLEDIYVHIESFDYDIPERSCIQLTADITISGMNEVEVQSESTYEEINPYPSLEMEPFHFEARRQFMTEHDEGSFSVNEEEEEEALDVQTFLSEYEGEIVEEGSEEDESETKEQEQEVLLEREKEEEQEQELLTEVEVRGEQKIPMKEEVEEQEQVVVESEIEETEEVEQQAEVRNEVDILVNIANDGARDETSSEGKEVELSDIDDEVEIEEATYSSRTEENALYLTKMLQNGEERFAKLKMCIIQENESLNTIAERYHLSTSQLIRANKLEGETVTEGQILYIPVTASR